MLEGKIGKGPFFRVQSDEFTVCTKQSRRKVQKSGGGGTSNRLYISASVLLLMSAKSGRAMSLLAPWPFASGTPANYLNTCVLCIKYLPMQG